MALTPLMLIGILGIVFMLKTQKFSKAFTIVELLVVIVVIGILAAVVIVAYNGVKKNAVNSVIQSTLVSVGKKIEANKQINGSYPTATLPDDITAPANIGLALAQSSSANEFCVNGTAQGYADIQWHVDQTLKVTTGLCAGAVIAGSVIGDYHGGTTPPPAGYVIPSRPQTAQSTGDFKLTASIPEAWDQLTLSWTAPAGMASSSTYEIQTRSSSTGDWYYHNRTDGSSDYASAVYSYSNRTFSIPYSTNSLTWSNANRMPKVAGADSEYRIRYRTTAGTFSEWDTVGLGNPIQSASDAPAGVDGFKVTRANDWSTITLSWDQLPSFAINMSEVSYEIQTRSSPTGTWYYHNRVDGASDYTSAVYSYSNRTFSIPYDTMSLTWPNRVPRTVGEKYEYRIRYNLRGSINSFSDWSVATLNNPIQSMADAPVAVTGFTVTPTSNWSSITMSWDQLPPFAVTMTEATYEIQTRSSANGTWYFHNRVDGSSDYTSAIYSYSNRTFSIPHTTTSLTWSSRMPAAGGHYEYRIRYFLRGGINEYSAWTTFSLDR